VYIVSALAFTAQRPMISIVNGAAADTAARRLLYPLDIFGLLERYRRESISDVAQEKQRLVRTRPVLTGHPG
jgi:hypothetical protein